MKQIIQENNEPKAAFFIDFTKASPEALDVILIALNAEVDEAISHRRFPSWEKAMERFQPATATLM